MLARLYEMKEEIMLFLMAEGSEKYVDLFADDDLRAKLAYLADIFGHLNDLNVSLQGPADTILGATTNCMLCERNLPGGRHNWKKER